MSVRHHESLEQSFDTRIQFRMARRQQSCRFSVRSVWGYRAKRQSKCLGQQPCQVWSPECLFHFPKGKSKSWPLPWRGKEGRVKEVAQDSPRSQEVRASSFLQPEQRKRLKSHMPKATGLSLPILTNLRSQLKMVRQALALSTRLWVAALTNVGKGEGLDFFLFPLLVSHWMPQFH